jgi:hypothetical protein
MEQFSQAIEAAGSGTLPFPWQTILIIFTTSILLGSLLGIITYVNALQGLDDSKPKTNGAKKSLIIGASNIVFLCVGLTGLMVLVNNSLARAFAIGAAMALVRFRAKLGQKSQGSNYLFGVVIGIACGLNELAVAWVVTGSYIILQFSLFTILKFKKS